MKITKIIVERIISYLFILLILNYSVGCSSYYRVLRTPAYEAKKFTSSEKIKSKFIVHHNDELYILRNISVDSISISGVIDSINKSQVFYSKDIKRKIYDSKNEGILEEVHIYIKQGVPEFQMGSINILLSKISEVRFIEKDDNKTRRSTVNGTTVLVIVFTITGIAILVSIMSTMRNL